jgi:hypothetical protein
MYVGLIQAYIQGSLQNLLVICNCNRRSVSTPALTKCDKFESKPRPLEPVHCQAQLDSLHASTPCPSARLRSESESDCSGFRKHSANERSCMTTESQRHASALFIATGCRLEPLNLVLSSIAECWHFVHGHRLTDGVQDEKRYRL